MPLLILLSTLIALNVGIGVLSITDGRAELAAYTFGLAAFLLPQSIYAAMKAAAKKGN